MSDRSIRSLKLPIQMLPGADYTYTHIDAHVSFYEGKYTLYVQPIEDHGNGCESFMCFSGTSILLERAGRFSAKHLKELAEK